MTTEQVEFKLNLDEEVLTFSMMPLKRREAMKIVHTFIGLLQKADGNISQVDFDDLEKISLILFKRCFVIKENGDSEEIKDIFEFFADKMDMWYEAIGEGLRANCPNFFQRLERK